MSFRTQLSRWMSAAALALLAERAPALLITDLRMPHLDGIGLLAKLR